MPKTLFISILRNRSSETLNQQENPNTIFICNLEKTQLHERVISKLKKLYIENAYVCGETKSERGITGKAWRERRHWRGGYSKMYKVKSNEAM